MWFLQTKQEHSYDAIRPALKSKIAFLIENGHISYNVQKSSIKVSIDVCTVKYKQHIVPLFDNSGKPKMDVNGSQKYESINLPQFEKTGLKMKASYSSQEVQEVVGLLGAQGEISGSDNILDQLKVAIVKGMAIKIGQDVELNFDEGDLEVIEITNV